MVEHLARFLNAERVRRFEDAQCPRNYCRHEYRDEQPVRNPIPTRKI